MIFKYDRKQYKKYANIYNLHSYIYNMQKLFSYYILPKEIIN